MNAATAPLASAPDKLLIPISSDWGDSGTTYYTAFVLDVTPALRQEINAAYAIIEAHPWMHSLSIHCSGICLPGSDNDEWPSNEADVERLEAVLDELNRETVERALREGEEPFFERIRAGRSDGERIVVGRYCEPILYLYERDGGEDFSFGAISALTPTKMHEEKLARQTRDAA